MERPYSKLAFYSGRSQKTGVRRNFWLRKRSIIPASPPMLLKKAPKSRPAAEKKLKLPFEQDNTDAPEDPF